MSGLSIAEIRGQLEEYLCSSKLEDSASEMHKAKAKVDYLEKMEKHILNNAKIQLTGSNANREMHAYASDSYRIHLQGVKAAREIYAEKTAIYTGHQKNLDILRSLNKNI